MKLRMFIVHRDCDVDKFRKLVELNGGVWVYSIRVPVLNFENKLIPFTNAVCLYYCDKDLTMEIYT
jgi:hypothetical protein